MDIPLIISLLETGQIDVALKEADKIPFTDDQRIIYNRKKETYIAGLQGQALLDWIKEMKVFLQSYHLKTATSDLTSLTFGTIWIKQI